MTVPKNKSRALAWGKEVERRARDYYRLVWPQAERAKRHGQEDYLGHPDIVGVPVHVQVKARAKTTVGTLFRQADAVRIERGTGHSTHLVTQDAGGQPLLTVYLRDYITERGELETWRKYGEAQGLSVRNGELVPRDEEYL
jgi:hypothetical protein